MEKNKSAYRFRLNNFLILSFKMKSYFKNVFLKNEAKKVGEVGTDEKFGRLDISSLEAVHGIKNSMNGEIVPNEETNSQSVKTENEKKKSKKDEKGRLARVEQNVERFAKFGLFCTNAGNDATTEKSRTIDLGTEISANGEITERKITIEPSAKYGYPTVGALEVFEGIQYLHSQNPETDIVTIPSVRYFITKILKQKYSDKARDAFLRHISELFNTSFALEHCFYSKDKEVYEKKLNKFHLLEGLDLRERKTKDVVRGSSSVRLNKYVFENIKLSYTKPFYIDTAFRIRSEIGKLLYRMLCFHFSHHDKFNYSTKKIFEQLNLNGDEYYKQSVRKRLLERAAKQIINQPISFTKTVESYEFQKSADNSDWNLIILATKTAGKLEQAEKGPIQAHSEPLEPEPNSNPKQKPKPLKTQNTASQRQVSKEASIETPIDIFISTFCELFPNAKLNRNSSQKVKKRVSEFVEHHGLENAKDFLVFCAEVGQRQEFSEVLKGQTVNYLFDFKAGDQHLIDAWLNNRGQKKIQGEQEAQQVKPKRFDPFEDLREEFRDEYQLSYIKPLYRQLDRQVSARFSKYTDKVLDERVAGIADGLAREMARDHYLHSSDDFVKRFISFYKADLGQNVLDLEQWILQYKIKTGERKLKSAANFQ